MHGGPIDHMKNVLPYSDEYMEILKVLYHFNPTASYGLNIQLVPLIEICDHER